MIGTVLCLVLMLAGVVSSTPAFAHAALLSSYPPDSILMQAAPGSIGLTFNEPVSIVSLQITDANGTRHPLVDGRLEGNSVVAGTPKACRAGPTPSAGAWFRPTGIPSAARSSFPSGGSARPGQGLRNSRPRAAASGI